MPDSAINICYSAKPERKIPLPEPLGTSHVLEPKLLSWEAVMPSSESQG